jgi:phenylacetate-CoA ligase
MADLKPEGYAGTPSFLKILVEKAEEKACAAYAHARPWSPAKPFRPACATGSPRAA